MPAWNAKQSVSQSDQPTDIRVTATLVEAARFCLAVLGANDATDLSVMRIAATALLICINQRFYKNLDAVEFMAMMSRAKAQGDIPNTTDVN